MKKLFAILVVLLIVPSLALAGKPQPPASGNMELVGFTTAITAPNIGLFGMTQLCQDEYLDSRMCTSKDIIETVNIPVLPESSYAWVQPIITSREGIYYTDISGRSYSATLSCTNWSFTASDFGLVITDIGKFTTRACLNTYLPVSCCAPAQ